MESVDPVLYQQCVVYIQDGVHQSRDGMALDDPNVVRTFEAEFNFEDYTAKGMAAPAPVELKPGGADITVNEANKAEYLQLFTEHRLVGETRGQIKAFQNGLGVFFGGDLLVQLRTSCTPADVLLLLCGNPEIDAADWRGHTQYTNGLTKDDQLVGWFWSVVGAFDNEHRAKLLHFSTGSSRAPAAGFAQLQGYNGAQHRFELQAVDGGPGRLPTAATCFNALRLPRYTSEQQLHDRLKVAMAGSGGFDEGAVAE